MKTTNLLIAFSIAFSTLISCKKISGNDELSRVVKTYDFVPFKIPRDSDGVGTLITFDNKTEAVIAKLTDCFIPKTLSIDTIQSTISNYSYNISKKDTVDFNTGNIFGQNANLNGAFNRNNVKNIEVRFTDLFEVRVTRISVERQLDSLGTNDNLCINRINDKDNHFIERVLGAKGVRVVLKDSINKAINIDLDLLSELDIDSSFLKNISGQSTLVFDKPRLIGYRTWQINIESEFNGNTIEINRIDPKEFIEKKKG